MVTLSNTWVTSYNNVPTQTTQTNQAQNVMFGLKSALVAAGYTVVSSSDSSTAGAGDKWISSTNLVWNTTGNPHSWIQLESPSGMLPSSNRAFILIDLTSTNVYQSSFSWASASFTGGSNTTGPTAPANAAGFVNKQFLHSTLTNSKYHYQYVSSGSQVGNFLFQTSQDGTGRMCFGFGFLASNGAESGDGWPCFGFSAFSEAGQGGMSAATIYAANASVLYHFDGTMTTATNLLTPSYNGTGDFMAQVTSAGSGVTGSYPDFPVVLCDVTSGKVSIRGYVVDLAYAPTGTSVTSGTVEPSTGPTTTTIQGSFWVPNGNSVPSL